MASNITLSAGVRQNLLALQNTASLLGTTQNRLATGKKVNSALDNPTNFFTSSALSARSSDLSSLLDSMSNGINTLKAADNGITAITTAVQTLKATITQARQDSSFKSTSYTIGLTTPATTDVLSISGGEVGTTPVAVEVTTSQAVETSSTNYADMDFDNGGVFTQTLTFTIAANGGTARTIVVKAVDADTIQATVDAGAATTFDVATTTDTVTIDDMVSLLNAAFDAATTPVGVTVSGTGANPLVFTADTAQSGASGDLVITAPVASGAPVLTASFGAFADPATYVNVAAKTVDQLVTEINANTSLIGKVKASNDGGKLNIQNLSTLDLSIEGATAASVINGDTGLSNTATIGGNTVRSNLITQFNDLRTQLDKLADDSSFNGVNLLRGDTLKIVFNENNSSSISIVSQNANGINTTVLGIGTATAAEFASNTTLDARLDQLGAALTQLRSQASAFGSNLSIVQNRQEFTKSMITTLQVGADALVLADSNEEAANLLALQTRQQLSTTALSLASQADQAVLRLF